MNETETSTIQKPKISKLAIAAILFGSFSLGTLLMKEPTGCKIGFNYESVYLLRLSAVLGLIFGIIGIFKIKISRQQLKGQRFAIVGILTGAASIILGVLGLAPWPAKPNPGAVCRTNLEGLGNAMAVYASSFDGKYPMANQWCDLLVMETDMTLKPFICPGSDAKLGESSYAMNKNVTGKRADELPKDIVVLFETHLGKTSWERKGTLGSRRFYYEFWELYTNPKDVRKLRKQFPKSSKVYKSRWNQIGGPEIITTDNHDGIGCFVLFNDGHVHFIRIENLSTLKW